MRTDGRFLKDSALDAATLDKIVRLNDLARERGESLAQMALKWVLKDGVVTSVLAGASKPEQILDNIKCMDGSGISAEELALIDDITLQ